MTPDLPIATAEQLARAREERALATDRLKRRQESWERSDTDGFLSQWASDLHARLHERRAELLEQGGVDHFPALLDGEGRRMRAKLIETKYGFSWLCLDSSDRVVGFLGDSLAPYEEGEPARFAPRSKAARLGYQRALEVAPVAASLAGRGTGLGGSVGVSTYRLDGGYPADALPFADDISL